MTTTEESQGARKYRLVAEIGRGGMADVFLAVVQGTAGFNKLVVLKKARADLVRDPDFVAMFLDEARLAARLSHPNVVQTHEVGQEGDQYFIAMEYLDGQALHRVRSRGLPLNMHLRVLIDALAGLHYAHELADFDGTPLGVVHRDATPQNIFVTYDGQVKVVDFGIAKALDSSTETKAGVIKGKVPYMAPEQVHGDRVDRRTDIFAMGVMLWEAVTGKRMWKKMSDIAILAKIGSGEIPTLRETAPDADPELAAICDRALAFDESKRFATAAEMHEALEGFLNASGAGVTAREVGKLVAEKFAVERAAVKRVVESELKDVRWSGQHFKITTAELPKLDLGSIQVTPTGPLTQPSSSPSHPSITTGNSGSLRTVNALVTTPGGSTGTDHVAAPPRKTTKIALAGAGLLAVVAVALGVKVLSSLTPGPAPATATAATAAPTQAATTAAPASTTAQLKIRVNPDKAKLTLDGALLGVGAYEGPIVKDGRSHTIRAEAPGFAPYEESITASADVALSWALQKEGESNTAAPSPVVAGSPWPRATAEKPDPAATPTQAAATATAVPDAPTASPTATLAPGQKPKRQIDPTSPYNQGP